MSPQKVTNKPSMSLTSLISEVGRGVFKASSSANQFISSGSQVMADSTDKSSSSQTPCAVVPLCEAANMTKVSITIKAPYAEPQSSANDDSDWDDSDDDNGDGSATVMHSFGSHIFSKMSNSSEVIENKSDHVDINFEENDSDGSDIEFVKSDNEDTDSDESDNEDSDSDESDCEYMPYDYESDSDDSVQFGCESDSSVQCINDLNNSVQFGDDSDISVQIADEIDLDDDETDSSFSTEGSSTQASSSCVQDWTAGVDVEKANIRWDAEIEFDIVGCSGIKVKFSDNIQVEFVDADIDRSADWAMYSRDAMRFKNKVNKLAPTLGPIFDVLHRNKIFNERFKDDVLRIKEVKISLTLTPTGSEVSGEELNLTQEAEWPYEHVYTPAHGLTEFRRKLEEMSESIYKMYNEMENLQPTQNKVDVPSQDLISDIPVVSNLPPLKSILKKSKSRKDTVVEETSYREYSATYSRGNGMEIYHYETTFSQSSTFVTGAENLF